MVRIEISNCPFEKKDELKQILPKKTLARWKWKDKRWSLTIQSQFYFKRFQKQLNSFIEENKLIAKTHEWDGFNQINNYT